MLRMEYRRLGRSGLQVSSLSLGSWLTFGAQISDDMAKDLMIKAYEAGVNFFDNAEIYAEGKSEVVMGNILKELGWDRSSFVVSSKVFFGDHRQGVNQKGGAVQVTHQAPERRISVNASMKR